MKYGEILSCGLGDDKISHSPYLFRDILIRRPGDNHYLLFSRKKAILVSVNCNHSSILNYCFMASEEFLYAACSGLMGFFVGLSELASRYRSFNKIFLDTYSWLYMLINFVTAFVVYIIVIQYDVPIGSLKEHHIGIVIFCGLSAMAFLRSSFFSYKDSTGKSIDIGPAALVSIFLHVAETQFDQLLSKKSIEQVEPIMQGINFVSASKDLPLIILASMRVLTSDEQKLLSDDILKLVNDNTITTETKNIALGLMLTRYAGIDVLGSSVKVLKSIYEDKTKQLLQNIQEVKFA